MRRLVLALAAAFVLVPAAEAAAPLQRVYVEADEFRFTVSRAAFKPGRVLVQLRNAGEDPHDLVVRRADRSGRGTVRFSETRPAALAERTLTVRRGTYELLCTLPGHAAAGMRAKVRVR